MQPAVGLSRAWWSRQFLLSASVICQVKLFEQICLHLVWLFSSEILKPCAVGTFLVLTAQLTYRYPCKRALVLFSCRLLTPDLLSALLPLWGSTQSIIYQATSENFSAPFAASTASKERARLNSIKISSCFVPGASLNLPTLSNSPRVKIPSASLEQQKASGMLPRGNSPYSKGDHLV